jgi:hypothetical protein
MSSQDTQPTPQHPPTAAPTDPPSNRLVGLPGRWRTRHANHRRARLASPHRRRVLARWLRRIARIATERDPRRRRHDVLLHDRAAAVRPQLLEIAASLEQAYDPDPACVHEIHELLANADSPLNHPDVHVSELHATLYYARARLAAHA